MYYAVFPEDTSEDPIVFNGVNTYSVSQQLGHVNCQIKQKHKELKGTAESDMSHGWQF